MFLQCKYIYVLDVGCGSGWMSCYWWECYVQVMVLDFSLLMFVQVCQKDVVDYYLVGDIEFLLLVIVMFDFVWSNFVVQWCGNLFMVFCELYWVVCFKGVVVFIMLVQGLLFELYQVWQVVDECLYVNCFLLLDEIEQLLNGVYY